MKCITLHGKKSVYINFLRQKNLYVYYLSSNTVIKTTYVSKCIPMIRCLYLLLNYISYIMCNNHYHYKNNVFKKIILNCMRFFSETSKFDIIKFITFIFCVM